MGRGRRGKEVDVGEVRATDVVAMTMRLAAFSKPYQALMSLEAQAQHLGTFVTGLVSSAVDRKSVEPIAIANGQDRGPLQHFIGASRWSASPILELMRSQVAQTLGDADGALIVDGSSVPKKGKASVGVARQWCGRLGKVENCQLGVYLAYAGKDSAVLLDRRLYLPSDWAKDRERRAKTHVPEGVRFKKTWELALDMLEANGAQLPHRWVVADSEYGRTAPFRDQIAARGAWYVVEIPSSTSARREGGELGRPPTWHSVATLRKRTPVAEWTACRVRDGQKGPIDVRVLRVPIDTKRSRGGPVRETLLVLETLDGSDRWYFLTNAPAEIDTARLVRAASRRHLIEEAFELGKGDAGLDEYEVRNWPGWHHHTACALLAGWFLVRESRRMGKKSAADDCEPGPVSVA